MSRAVGPREPVPLSDEAGGARSLPELGAGAFALVPMGALGSIVDEEVGPASTSEEGGRDFAAGALVSRGFLSLSSAVTKRSSPQLRLAVSGSTASGNLISGIVKLSGKRSTEMAGLPTGVERTEEEASSAVRIGLAASNSSIRASVSSGPVESAIFFLKTSIRCSAERVVVSRV